MVKIEIERGHVAIPELRWTATVKTDCTWFGSRIKLSARGETPREAKEALISKLQSRATYYQELAAQVTEDSDDD